MERIKAVAEQLLTRLPAVKGKGEEATKQALVLPVLDALGYDIWHPGEVCPEFEADFATKKFGQKEKVDIAILLNELPRIFFEVKPVDMILDGHEGQLARYFNATPSVSVAILTNGLEWRFFTDTGEPNLMDAQPFHVVRFDAGDQGLEVFMRFAKAVFVPESIRDYATELRYMAKFADFFRREIDLRDREPSEYLMRWVLKSEGTYDGVVNSNVIERFRGITKAAHTCVIREIVRRSVAAMEEGATQGSSGATSSRTPDEEVLGSGDETPSNAISTSVETCDMADSRRGTIDTTEEELRLFSIAKEQFEHSALADATVYDSRQRKEVPATIAWKDTINYFSVYVNRPAFWVLRANLAGRSPWIAFNIDPLAAASLKPSELQVLPSMAWAPFRVHVAGAEDMHKLHRLFFATAQKVISERKRPDDGSVSEEPEFQANVVPIR